MRRSAPLLALLAPAILLSLLAACDRPSSPAAPPACVPAAAASGSAGAPPGADVLVTVNGAPIRVSDLHYVLSKGDRGRGMGADAARAKAQLEKLIDEELTRQAAVSLRLEDDPEYQKKLRFMEAPLREFEREELTELYFTKQVEVKSRVEPAEVRKHFDDDRERFQTEIVVAQISVRDDEAKIKDLKKQLDAGASFDDVAAKLAPQGAATGGKSPWEVGPLKWNEVPEPWRAALESMKPGEVSEIIRGPKGRYAIIKLVKRQVNAAITLEQLEPALTRSLQSAKLAGLGKKLTKDLRDKAAIVYVREPAAMPPPSEPD